MLKVGFQGLILIHLNLFITLLLGVQADFHVSYPISVIMRVKCVDSIAKIVQMGSNNDQSYIKNRVVTNHVKKRSRCNLFCPRFYDG